MPLTALDMVASAVSQTASVTAPADIQAGDLLAYYALGKSSTETPPTAVTPTGFTPGIDTSVSPHPGTTIGFRTTLDLKIADGSEASAVITGMDGSSGDWKALLVYRGDGPITGFTVSAAVGSQYTNGNPTPQSVVASGGVAPLIVIASWHSDQNVSPRTFDIGGVDAKDGEVEINTANYVAHRSFLSSPSDIDVDMQDESLENILHSFFIEVEGGDEALLLDEGLVGLEGQSLVLALAAPLAHASLPFTGQAIGLNTRLALTPAALHFAGANIGFAYLQVDPAIIALAGQAETLRSLAPSRIRSALRIPGTGPSTDGRMVTYWKGTRG